MHQLKLFIKESCPYCVKVMDYLEERNLTVETADIVSDPNNREQLVSIGGKSQVPMLLIDGKALYESNDIIEWFKENM